MSGTNSIRANNEILTNWLYDVQPLEKEKTAGDRLQQTGNQILLGSAAIIGLPLLGKPFKKPYQSFKNMDTRNGISYLDAWRALSEQTKGEKAALKGDNIWQSYRNRSLYHKITGMSSEIPAYIPEKKPSKLNAKQRLKQIYKYRKNSYYNEAKRLIEETKQMLETAKKNGTTIPKETLKAQLNKIREAVRAGDIKVNSAMKSGIIKPTSLLGRVKHKIKLKTGGYKIEEKLLQSTKGSSALKIASKGLKGTGLMALIEGAIEIPDIISAYKIDKAEKAEGRKSNRGNKQLAKSGVKVGSSILGYAAGAAAAGAIAGSVVPGIGNVAGAVIGFVGGIIGGAIASWGAGKIMDEVLNEKDSLEKSEAVLYAEEQNEKTRQVSKTIAAQASNNSRIQDELLMEVQTNIDKGAEPPDEVLAAYEYLLNERETALETEYGSYALLDMLSNIANSSYAA